MTQQIISVDSQMLSSYQSCPTKFKYRFRQNLHSTHKAEALEKGDLMHKLLEVSYSMKIGQFAEREIAQELRAAGLTIVESTDHDVIRNYCNSVSDYFSTKLSLPYDDCREIVHHYNEYWDFYRNDTWHALAVEEVGSKLLYEDENIKMLYNVKIDLVAELGNTIAPWDHKTSKRRQQPNSMHNQFIGYCFALGVNNIVINTIGFQKTLSPKERFNRFILTIDDQRIEEWRRNTVRELLNMKNDIETDTWVMRYTSCNDYSDGCDFLKICESSPDGRLYKIERDFHEEAPWDPASRLEVNQ